MWISLCASTGSARAPITARLLGDGASMRSHVISHQSAAIVWGIALVQPPDVQHVTVPRNASRRVLPGMRQHRADLPPGDVARVDGVWVTTPVRTVLDLGRALPLPEGVAAVDAALRLGVVRRGELGRRVGLARGPGSARLTRTLALADPRSESLLESYCRALLAVAGVPPERTQYEVRTRGRLIGRVDFAWPSRRLVVEVDGFAFHADRRSYRRDRRRQNALELAGWLVLRFSWEDVLTNPSYVTESVRAALGDVAA